MSNFDKIVESVLRDSDLTKSLASLIQYNDGKFKSDKQAKFILSKAKKGEKDVSSFYKKKMKDNGAEHIIISEPSMFKGKSYKQVYFVDSEGVVEWMSAHAEDFVPDHSEDIVDARKDMKAGGLTQDEYDDIVRRSKQREREGTTTKWMHKPKWKRK